MSEPIFISEKIVLRLLTWESTFQATEAALASVSQKERAVQNPRSFTKSPDSLLLTMPGYLQDSNFGGLACKLVTVSPKNTQLPTINANIALFDETTGVLKAVVAGTEITKWRTAAASAVATKYLTAAKKIQVLAVLGAGAQGHIHAVAFNNFFNFKEIRIWNRNKARAEHLASTLNKTFNCEKFKCFESNEECVRDADVIVTATFAENPIVRLEWLKEGAHINAVGAGLSHHSELSESVYLASNVYIDHRSGAETELSGLRKLGVEFTGEIAGLISQELKAPLPKQLTVFQSLGMAVEDCAMARLVYDLYNTNLRK